jgi:hypothetical protein
MNTIALRAVSVSLYLDAEVISALDAKAQAESRSRSAVAERLLVQALQASADAPSQGDK